MKYKKDKLKIVLERLHEGVQAAFVGALELLTAEDDTDTTPHEGENAPVTDETTPTEQPPTETAAPVVDAVERPIEDAANDFDARLRRALEILEKGVNK